jgi:serine/threonine protein kinase
MSGAQQRDDDEFWQIEHVARKYELELKQGAQESTIEVLLESFSQLPRQELLKALIETELDVYGMSSQVLDSYLQRFPNDVATIRGIANIPIDHERPPLSERELVGDLRVERLIGKGAIGFVYLAEDLGNHSKVAIKILRPDWKSACGDSSYDLFRNEAKIGSSLNYPSIVKHLRSGEHSGLPFHVLEYVDGMTLRDFRGSRTLDPVVCSKIIADVADAIHHSHRKGVVHRDLKPSNILIDRFGKAHVTDFGIALADYEQGTGSRIAGTPLYMSPEQVSGESHLVDGRTDIYSLGVMLYEAVTGSHPTLGTHATVKAIAGAILNKSATPLRQRVKVSPMLERICMKALAKSPSDRFSTAEDFAKSLRRFVMLNRVRRLAPLAIGCGILMLTAFYSFILKRDVEGPDLRSSSQNSNVTELASNEPVESTKLDTQEIITEKRSLSALLSNGVEGMSPGDSQVAAKLIVAAIRSKENESDGMWQYFASGADNTLQTALIHLCASEGLDWKLVVDRIASEPRADIRSALILTLGEYTLEGISQRDREQLMPGLLQDYCKEPSSSVHSAIAWTLRRWGLAETISEIDRHSGFAIDDAREWYNTLPDIAMVVCELPPTGSEAIPWKYAISTHEISATQWIWNTGDFHNLPEGIASRRPKNYESWHNCASFCNKLSSRVGLPPSEYCYERLSEGLYRSYADATRRRGFRMLTVPEWTHAARAKSTTRRHWGRLDSMLAYYANCRPLSHFVTKVSGTYKPNGFGIFDTLGNVSEWIHSSDHQAESSSVVGLRPVRGGSAWTTNERVHVDADFTILANDNGQRLGLRLAQSLIPFPSQAESLRLVMRSRAGIAIPDIASERGNAGPSETIRVESNQVLTVGETVFIGTIGRGETMEHCLLIENQLSSPLSLHHVSFDGCLESINSLSNELTIRSGASVELPVRVSSTGSGTQKGRVVLRWRDDTQAERMFEIAAFISGPKLSTMEDPVLESASVRIDFGTVAPGTSVRQLITLLNVGDRKLSISKPQASGALLLREAHPDRVDIVGVQHYYCDFQMDTTVEGIRQGTIAIPTGDPLAPLMKIKAEVQVKQLAKVPVIGLFREGEWLLDYTHDGISDQTIHFGGKGDVPLTGDFDGDGFPELALLHRDGSEAQLELWIRFQKEQEAERIQVRKLGVASGQVVIGDYNGDRKCDVAWVEFSETRGIQVWHVDTDGDDVWDLSIDFGLKDDVPVLGDWNGDGKDELGVIRLNNPANGLNGWLLNREKAQIAMAEIPYGLPGDLPLAADWNGDGKTDIGVFRMTLGVGQFLLDLDFDPASERYVRFGMQGDVPVAFMAPPLPGNPIASASK